MNKLCVFHFLVCLRTSSFVHFWLTQQSHTLAFLGENLASWPDVLLVFDGASDITHPQLMAILLGYHDGTDARGLQMGDLSGIPRSITISGQTVTVVSLGYVSSDPNCCPSQRVTDTFTWNGSGFTRGARSVIQAKAP